MTAHLSPSEFVDQLDGSLTGERAAHAQQCPHCAAEAQRLTTMRSFTAAVEPFEPSPLFWPHLSSRILGALALERRPLRAGAWRIWLPAMLGATVASLVVIVAVTIAPRTRVVSHTRADAVSARPAAEQDLWQQLSAAASEMGIEHGSDAGLAVPPRVVDGALADLSPAERETLSRLLRTELQRRGL